MSSKDKLQLGTLCHAALTFCLWNAYLVLLGSFLSVPSHVATILAFSSARLSTGTSVQSGEH